MYYDDILFKGCAKGVIGLLKPSIVLQLTEGMLSLVVIHSTLLHMVTHFLVVRQLSRGGF